MPIGGGAINTKSIFEELSDVLESDELPATVNAEVERCNLNLSTLTNLKENPKRLLANIKRLLLTDSSDSILDFELLLELLNNLISICSFEDVLATFSIEDLKISLNSNVSPLIKAACKVVSKSYPKGLFANSEIFDILLNLYFDKNLEISIINSIERAISELSSDELVRRRILVNNFPLLIAIKKKFEPTLMARLLEILNIECGFMEHNEFNEKLFIIRPEEILKSLDLDIVMFIHILVYYTRLLDETRIVEITKDSHEWMLRYALPIIPTFGRIFAENEDHSDVKYFARSYIFKLFRTISYLDDDNVFRSLDNEYIHISAGNENVKDFLSFVNPAYLFKYYPALITEYSVVTPSKLSIVRNVISDKPCFDLIKAEINAESVLSMPYMEQMVLLQRFSQIAHCVHYLIQFLPKVMSNLINNENGDIIESETVALRRETIENLLKFDKHDLNVWYLPLKNELEKIHNGGRSRNEAQFNVASSYI